MRPDRGAALICADCGTVALRPYPQPVTRGDWIWVNDTPPYQLCPPCHRARVGLILNIPADSEPVPLEDA